MNRDMEVIRAVLLTADDEGTTHLQDIPLQIAAFHVQLCIDAGFVEGKVVRDFDGRKLVYQRWAIMRLTWQGAEALDAMRDDTTWRRAKEHVLRPAGSWTFSLLIEWLKQEAKARIFGNSIPT